LPRHRSSILAETGDGSTVPDYEGGGTPPFWSGTPPSARVVADVCQAWADATPAASTVVITTVETCDPGQLTETARGDVMRRINLYRWLVGMPYVREATPFLDDLQACASYPARHEITVTHAPPTDRACYTDPARDMAQKSNLAAGLNQPTDGIDLFVDDIGHRALILAPGLVATAVGYFDGVLCQLMFDENWTWSPDIHRTIA